VIKKEVVSSSKDGPAKKAKEAMDEATRKRPIVFRLMGHWRHDRIVQTHADWASVGV
jgi:hypothetical protein